MEYTTHYHLPLWGEEDAVKRTDFNENNQKIDAALVAGAQIVTGSYTGTGTYGEANPSTLTFDIEPKLVILFKKSYYGPIANTRYTGSCCGTSTQFFYFGGSRFGVYDTQTDSVKYTLSEKMLSWYAATSAAAQMNAQATEYSYIAMG